MKAPRGSGLQPDQQQADPGRSSESYGWRKLRHYHVENYPYFVTTATLDRQPIFADYRNASLFKEILYETQTRYRFLLLSFVIMPDHFHGILVPRPGDSISQVMRFIKGTYARDHNRRRGTNGAVWQPAFHDRTLRTNQALKAAIEYIEANPVKAGLSATASGYRFSSVHRACPADLDRYLAGRAEGPAYEVMG